ncbi:hypothetical protein BBK36DRAFT_1169917 [Trichoderma citrinoviride]|uniref:Uncharacterized protein n=1 Tax=Trichoderma citrinoviride TaxID=58853 RepID=A0A2T4B737_9HYPO|nr:hypothetical protein BBK36DRAFT_1169917 [Trichoderma citrinoviride]PTB65153.1 hypothetical protein BBK36DRAFT_1169917 [Trichoderma citrinoviride]
METQRFGKLRDGGKGRGEGPHEHMSDLGGGTHLPYLQAFTTNQGTRVYYRRWDLACLEVHCEIHRIGTSLKRLELLLAKPSWRGTTGTCAVGASSFPWPSILTRQSLGLPTGLTSLNSDNCLACWVTRRSSLPAPRHPISPTANPTSDPAIRQPRVPAGINSAAHFVPRPASRAACLASILWPILFLIFCSMLSSGPSRALFLPTARTHLQHLCLCHLAPTTVAAEKRAARDLLDSWARRRVIAWSETSPRPPCRRDTLLARVSSPAASNQTQTQPQSSPPSPSSANAETPAAAAAGLSASEPTLRFPRPRVNKQLANWISSSNPNIMELAPNHDDNGLSESTYELVSGPNTDTEESPDDNYPGSISESVGSLDRADDVRSLDGTDDSYETESAVDDGASSDRDETEEEEDDEDSVHEDTVLAESQITNEDNKLEPFPVFENDIYSQSSLEYTHQSLGTPSFPTPDASRVIERPADDEKKKSWSTKASDALEATRLLFKEAGLEATWEFFPSFMFVLVALIGLHIFLPASPSSGADKQMPPPITATVTTTSYLTSSSSSLPTSSSSSLVPSSTNGVALMPISDAQSVDWIFGAKRPTVSFTAEANNEIVIHIPENIKKTWLTKDCLTVTTKRDEVLVDTTVSPVDEGLRLKFAKRDSHGVISVVLEASCRPKIHKVVKVRFVKGLMEGALERTKHLAHDLSGLVPAAAQEAERCIENAKQSLGSACQNVCHTVSETVSKTFGGKLASIADVRQHLGDLAMTAKAQLDEAASKIDVSKIESLLKKDLPWVKDAQNKLQLQLLDAQLSAKLWWLQAFGSAEEHEEYLRKAKSYSADKHAAAAEMKHAEKDSPELLKSASRFWARLVNQAAP